MEPSGAIEHEIAMGVCPELHGKFPDVVALQFFLLDSGCQGIGNQVERGRAPRAEVVREPAGAGAGTGENVIEDTGMGQGVIQVAVHDVD